MATATFSGCPGTTRREVTRVRGGKLLIRGAPTSRGTINNLRVPGKRKAEKDSGIKEVVLDSLLRPVAPGGPAYIYIYIIYTGGR